MNMNENFDIAYSFNISKDEDKKLKKWQEKHRKKCKRLLTYCFTPTGIGNIIKVRCDCGKELDLTDVSSW
jgi:hypothetical protein